MTFSKSVKRKIKKTYGVKNLAEAEKILQAGYEVKGKTKEAINEGISQALTISRVAIRQEIMSEVMANCLLVELFVEYEKYGCKKIRLRKRLNYLLEVWGLLSEPEKYNVSTQALNNILINEAGFDACAEINQNNKDCEADEKRRKELYGSVQKVTERCMSVQEAGEHLARGRKLVRDYWQDRGNTPFFIKLSGDKVVDDEGKPYTFTLADLQSEDWAVV